MLTKNSKISFRIASLLTMTACEVMERFLEGVWGQALLPEYVFLEVVTVLQARRNLETATAVGEILLNAQEVQFVPCSNFFKRSLEIFYSQAQNQLSFTDATIVGIARQPGIRNVATFDRDFVGIEGILVVPE